MRLSISRAADKAVGCRPETVVRCRQGFRRANGLRKSQRRTEHAAVNGRDGADITGRIRRQILAGFRRKRINAFRPCQKPERRQRIKQGFQALSVARFHARSERRQVAWRVGQRCKQVEFQPCQQSGRRIEAANRLLQRQGRRRFVRFAQRCRTIFWRARPRFRRASGARCRRIRVGTRLRACAGARNRRGWSR